MQHSPARKPSPLHHGLLFGIVSFGEDGPRSFVVGGPTAEDRWCSFVVLRGFSLCCSFQTGKERNDAELDEGKPGTVSPGMKRTQLAQLRLPIIVSIDDCEWTSLQSRLVDVTLAAR